MTDEPFELLRRLAYRYHHVKQQNKGQGPGSSRGRRFEEAMRQLEREFDQAVDRWVEDDRLHDAWIAHFYHFTPPPRGPRLPPPPLFKGRDAGGQQAQLIPAPDGALELEIDGKPVRRVTPSVALPEQPVRRLRVAGLEFEETFDAPEEAQAALEEYADNPQRGAPWQFVGELYRDGIVDPHFGLTPRGRRLMDARHHRGPGVEIAL